MSTTPGPWIMKLGDPETREYWGIEAPASPHPLGPEYTRSDNVVGTCCSAGVYREEDAKLICAAPKMKEFLEWAMGMPCQIWDSLPEDVRKRWQELVRSLPR